MLGGVIHKSQNKQKNNGLKEKVRKVGGHLDRNENSFELKVSESNQFLGCQGFKPLSGGGRKWPIKKSTKTLEELGFIYV
jgi:hypothetical protein